MRLLTRCAYYPTSTVVGHIPRFTSTARSLFIRRGGSIYCTITGSRRYSRDIPQGEMEISCTFCFMRNGGELKKLKNFFTKTPLGSDDNTAKHVVLDTDTISTSTMKALSSSKDGLVQSSSPDVVVVRQPSPGPTAVLTNTISLYDQPLFSTEGSVNQSNIEICHQPLSSDIQSQSKIGKASSQNPKAVGTLESRTTVIDHSLPNPLLDQSILWVSFERRVLHVNDKLLIQNKELTDKHINFVQSMIKKKFSTIGGLCSTLLLNKSSSRDNRTVKIVHCKKRRHWITASTKWYQNNEVAVYDSVFKRLDLETRTTIMRIFG